MTPILVLVCLYKQNVADESFWRLIGWTALLVWIRFGMLLRTIRSLSWMLTLMSESVFSMLQFLLVLIIGIVAFADAFGAIDRILMIQGHVPMLEHVIEGDERPFFDTYLKYPFLQWQKSFYVTLGEFHMD